MADKKMFATRVNNELLKEKHSLSGSFKNENIQSVLTKICLALNLKYEEMMSALFQRGVIKRKNGRLYTTVKP